MSIDEKRAKQKRIDMFFKTVLVMIGIGWVVSMVFLTLAYTGRLC